MKFYNREDELALLKRADKLKDRHSIMTMLIGRRRVGKTTLVLQPFSKERVLYFFVSRKDEKLLYEEFVEEIKDKLNIPIYGNIKTFDELFSLLLEIAKKEKFTLIIDEFQEFYKVNPTVYSTMQKLWDLNKKDTNLHLIVCGSVYSLMKRVFEDNKEPLFGRVDFKMDLKPLKVSVLETILKDYKSYSAQNLLDFYILTGGIAKYIELFVLYDTFTQKEMIDEIVKTHSLFLDEGKNRLIEEFGKEYGVYFSILSLIASSKTSASEISSILEKNVSGYLSRLEKDYSIIKSIKPIGAKPNTKVQKYEIVDNFLAFWFRFIFKYQSLIEIENYKRLKGIIHRDWSTFSRRFLEKLFIEKFKESGEFTQIGSYWERKNQNEIDIVAVDEIEKRLVICEVKLTEKRLNHNVLVIKAKKLVERYRGYEVEYRLLSLRDL